MSGAGTGRSPWRLLAGAGLILFLLVPVRAVHGRWAASSRRVDHLRVATATVEERAQRAEAADPAALAADLAAIEASMPTGPIDSWIDEVSALARGTGSTWRAATVTGVSAAPPGEPSATTVDVVVDGPPRALLTFVDQLRTGTARLTLVDSFALSTGRPASLSVTLRLLGFVPADPPPMEPT